MILAISCFIIYNKAGSVYICSELLMFYILPYFLKAFTLLIYALLTLFFTIHDGNSSLFNYY